MDNPIYIGDGVYAYHDGFGIELRLGDHRNPCAVYLEPLVMKALVEWKERTEAEMKAAAKPPAKD